MGNFKLYLNKLSYRHAGRLWARSEGIKATCMSMFYLNRTVSHYQVHSKAIYALKNRLVQWLYQNGYCISVKQQTQTLECWTCGGTGEYWTGVECWKCTGSGVYAVHTLYRFVFNVNGRRYVWHQPRSTVTFDVQLDTDNPILEDSYTGKRSGFAVRTPALGAIYYFTVKAFLEECGIVDLPDIGPSFSSMFYAVTANFRGKGKLYRARVRIMDKVRAFLGLPEYEDIPF